MEATLQRPEQNYEYDETQNINTVQTRQPRDTLMNNQRRDKLKQTLIDKFMKTFGESAVKPIIEKEVTTFLKRDKLNDYDLQQLERTLQSKLSVRQNKQNLKKNLQNPLQTRNQAYNQKM